MGKLDFALALRFIGLQLPLVEIVGALTIARIAFLVPTPGGLGALEASQMLAMQADSEIAEQAGR